ncbi:uncharacterized protein LOC124795598 [Schistocerca piceifrons]|uniref:uncharacterized protein LOC124795598 n=1 Tax=Schistocerca piceifrons TaxID=274613 RepID=UPI001F5EFE41|nr:uncharacterized protein LOC124795598 [Schistocerca piceifrons]
MYLYPVTPKEVQSAINKLKSKMSCGFDGIPDQIIRYSTNNVVAQHVDIINDSFESGVFPNKLKQSTVGVKPTDPTQFPPAFPKNEVLCSEQHVFRNKRSTTTAIYEYMKSILSLMDKKLELTGVFIELSKGFDMVDHKILLSILETYGIQGLSNN